MLQELEFITLLKLIFSLPLCSEEFFIVDAYMHDVSEF